MSEALTRHLASCLAVIPIAPLCVAFSGGLDSTVLLHALAHLPVARQRGLRALHVNHNLHAASAIWVAHCQDVCTAWHVPFTWVHVQVDTQSGEGCEAAARRARYQAFVQQLGSGEWLLLAHHRDDQIETVLLKLLRGAGPEGLGGMRRQRTFGKGQLWRPLLTLSRAQLHTHFLNHRLSCIDDPSNADIQLSRNYLRHIILPQLTRHWPQASDSILHSAALLRAATDALRTQWLPAFESLHDVSNGSLSLPGWLALPEALRGPVLDHWLHGRHLSAPTIAQRRQIERQSKVRSGRTPCIRWPGVELYLWRQRLWALSPRPLSASHWHCAWDGRPLPLPDGGWLRLTHLGARLIVPLEVRLRRGGEHIKPMGDRHTRALRNLFQQAALPPWQRRFCPLMHVGDELVAVADRWLSDRGQILFQTSGGYPEWQPGA